MKLYVKNMVCNRCKMVVKSELEKLGLQLLSVELGEVETLLPLSVTQKMEIAKQLKLIGFELIEDKKSITVEKIKILIVELIYHKNNELNINLSEYISQNIFHDYASLSHLFSETEGTAQNIKMYKEKGVKFIVEGGEKHETTGHSFNSENNYKSAINLDATRVVSCNTTSILRTLSALKRADLLDYARGTLLRRATDPWESHLGGIMNTMVPEKDIPSHQRPDAQSVDPDLNVITSAVKVPETLSHMHYWNVKLKKQTTKEDVLKAFKTSSRIKLIRYDQGLVSNNTIKEMFMDMGRPWGDMYEVALWEDMLKVVGDELFYAYVVDNQAIVIPETIDAIRALTGIEMDGAKSIAKTNESLGIH